MLELKEGFRQQENIRNPTGEGERVGLHPRYFPVSQIAPLLSLPESLQVVSMLEDTGPEWLCEEVKTGVSNICKVFGTNDLLQRGNA